MKISEGIKLLNTELLLMRTPCGRPINEYAQKCIETTIADTKNHEQNLMKCKNCCIIYSSLLFSNGCENCGGHDLDMEGVTTQ